MKFEILKENPQSIDKALNIAMKAQNATEISKLRYGGEKHLTQVNSIRNKGRNNECKKSACVHTIQSKVRCYFCKMQGHIQRKCRQSKVVRNLRNQENSHSLAMLRSMREQIQRKCRIFHILHKKKLHVQFCSS